jgi:TPR repeat protein
MRYALSNLSSSRGCALAQVSLGNIYYLGHGVPQDYAEAVKWYRLAADQGYALAQFTLGTMYGNGQGVPQDYVRAHMWLNLSTTAGNRKVETM